MDAEDPLHQFLKSTGWSPEDLLKKLQTYKSFNTSTLNNEKECAISDSKSVDIDKTESSKCIIASTSKLTENGPISINKQHDEIEKNSIKIKENSVERSTNSDEPSTKKTVSIEQKTEYIETNEIYTSSEKQKETISKSENKKTSEIFKNDEVLINKITNINLTNEICTSSDQPEEETGICNTTETKKTSETYTNSDTLSTIINTDLTNDIKENEICNESEVSTYEMTNNLTKENITTNEISINSTLLQTTEDANESNKSKSFDSLNFTGDFSDTDEEEVEVKETNSHIINEIIEDITNDHVPSPVHLKSLESVPKHSEVSEVKIVRVIEIEGDEEDEDDDFEDECCSVQKISDLPRKSSGSEIFSLDEDCHLTTYDKPNVIVTKRQPINQKDVIVISSSSSDGSVDSSDGIDQISKFDKTIKLEISKETYSDEVIDQNNIFHIKSTTEVVNEELKNNIGDLSKNIFHECDNSKLPENDLVLQLTNTVEEINKNQSSLPDLVIQNINLNTNKESEQDISELQEILNTKELERNEINATSSFQSSSKETAESADMINKHQHLEIVQDINLNNQVQEISLKTGKLLVNNIKAVERCRVQIMENEIVNKAAINTSEKLLHDQETILISDGEPNNRLENKKIGKVIETFGNKSFTEIKENISIRNILQQKINYGQNDQSLVTKDSEHKDPHVSLERSFYISDDTDNKRKVESKDMDANNKEDCSVVKVDTFGVQNNLVEIKHINTDNYHSSDSNNAQDVIPVSNSKSECDNFEKSTTLDKRNEQLIQPSIGSEKGKCEISNVSSTSKIVILEDRLILNQQHSKTEEAINDTEKYNSPNNSVRSSCIDTFEKENDNDDIIYISDENVTDQEINTSKMIIIKNEVKNTNAELENSDKDSLNFENERNLTDELKSENAKEIFNINDDGELTVTKHQYTTKINCNELNNSTKNKNVVEIRVCDIILPHDQQTNRSELKKENTVSQSEEMNETNDERKTVTKDNSTNDLDPVSTLPSERKNEKQEFIKRYIFNTDKHIEKTLVNNIDDNCNDSSDSEKNRRKDNLEDIRSHLKLQLNSLRTRKKGSLFSNFKKPILEDKIIDNSCKSIIKENNENDTDKNKIESSEVEKIMKNKFRDNNPYIETSTSDCLNFDDNNLYNQTNELGLVIASVQGGIDLVDDENISNIKCDGFVNEENVSHVSGTDSHDTSVSFKDNLSNNIDGKEIAEEANENNVYAAIRKIIRKQRISKTEETLDSRDISNFEIFNKTSKTTKEDSILEKNDDLNSSTENTRSFSNLDESSQIPEKNSPFVSNTLDEFLTENAKLNISYKVPKCEAEDGLKYAQIDESPLILKKIVNIKSDPEQKIIKTSKVKAKTLAQKRKLLERQIKREQKKLKKQKIAEKIKIEQKSRNYVLYKDKKVFVRTKPNLEGQCIERIESKTETKHLPETVMCKKKLSLLAADKKICSKVKYLPGPLCKKDHLQVNGNCFWETKLTKLPQIFLDIIPTSGKQIPPEILFRLPQNDGKISLNQIEFALSALPEKYSQKSPLKMFRYPVRYQHNQQYILTKTKVLNCQKYDCASDKLKCDADTVEAVIEDLITYVELKELAPTLIKDDVREMANDDTNETKFIPFNESASTVIKKPKKKSRIDQELLRLSCKVVNVEVEEEEERPCEKAFCRLGCVCKSLKCDSYIIYHCQKPSCMFQCSCPKERAILYDHTVTLPAGTDVLSVDAVNRIEGEAKKNLAKVEREFTQTVIHTNDKTIVVGLGMRSKSRRNVKAPVKYTNFFEDIEIEQPKPISKKEFYKKCEVSLINLNLSDIMPYCLVHFLYNCYCKGESIYSPLKRPLQDRNTELKNNFAEPRLKRSANFIGNKTKIMKTNDYTTKIDKYSFKRSQILEKPEINNDVGTKQTFHYNPDKTSSNSSETSSRPVRVIKKPSRLSESYYEPVLPQNNKKSFTTPEDVDDTLSTCCRTSEILPSYLKRHKIVPELFTNDFSNNLSESDLFKAQLFSDNKQTLVLEVDILKQQLIKSSGLLNEKSNKRKRKQIIEVRNEESTSAKSNTNNPSTTLNYALQRRKKSKALIVKSRHIKPIFEGEIILNESNMELLKKMGKKTVEDGYARLLPWKYLIKGFDEQTINIWCMIDQPSRLLMNLANPFIQPPSNYVDIRLSKQSTQVILWICRKKLPANYIEDNVSFILKESRGHFEICGVCTKNLVGDQLGHDMIPSRLIASSSNEQNFVHKDMNGISQLLVLTKNRYKLQELIEDSSGNIDDTSISKNMLYMWTALPEIQKFYKWKMIFLNSDFTYLYFTHFKYTIKYTDLLSASSIAKHSDCTVMLRNADMQDNYDHKSFGIYFDPHYQDRLFIGPYLRGREYNNDIGTLRYINQTLVCTETFNRMRGQENYKCGYWLVERPYSGEKEKERKQSLDGTIDLTKDEDNEREELKFGINDSSLKDVTSSTKNVIIHNGEKIKVIDSAPKNPEDFNRYIITNIPHFGYLGAFQYDSSQEIDVQWPFENKLLRFANERCAADFLQSRFSSLLVSVPSTFKITVIVLTQIDLKNSQPINASILSGHYICGEFGFYNILSLTQELCMEKLKIPKEEVLRIFLTRAREVVKERTDHLSSMLNIGTYSKGDCDFVTVLDSATKEIGKLKELTRKNIVIKNKLLVSKRNRAKRVFQLISELPPEQRNQESLKFWSTMNRVEPIEIQDSDDEETKNKKGAFKQPEVRTNTSGIVNFNLPKYVSVSSDNKLKICKCLLCTEKHQMTFSLSKSDVQIQEHLNSHLEEFKKDTEMSIDEFVLEQMTVEDFFQIQDITLSDDDDCVNIPTTSSKSIPVVTTTSSIPSSTVTSGVPSSTVTSGVPSSTVPSSIPSSTVPSSIPSSTVTSSSRPVLKSILKPLVRISTEKGNSVLVRSSTVQPLSPTNPYIPDVMLKNLSKGKYVLVHNSKSTSSKLSNGMKVVIQNNSVQSVTNTEPIPDRTGDTNLRTCEPLPKTIEDSDCEFIEEDPLKVDEKDVTDVHNVDSESDTQFEEDS